MKRTVRIVENGLSRKETVETLEDLQRLVGGYVEAVPVSENFTVWVNEEGKLRGLKPTLRWPAAGDVLRGPVVFDGVPDDEGESTELTGDGFHEAAQFVLRNIFLGR